KLRRQGRDTGKSLHKIQRYAFARQHGARVAFEKRDVFALSEAIAILLRMPSADRSIELVEHIAEDVYPAKHAVLLGIETRFAAPVRRYRRFGRRVAAPDVLE